MLPANNITCSLKGGELLSLYSMGRTRRVANKALQLRMAMLRLSYQQLHPPTSLFPLLLSARGMLFYQEISSLEYGLIKKFSFIGFASRRSWSSGMEAS